MDTIIFKSVLTSKRMAGGSFGIVPKLMHSRWGWHLHKFTIHRDVEFQRLTWMIFLQLRNEAIGLACLVYMLRSMKLHHTSRLILIKRKFAAKLLWITAPWCPQQTVICVSSLGFFYDVDHFRWWMDGEYWVLHSWGSWLFLDFIALRLFIVIVFLRMIFPWTEGSCLSVLYR